MQFKENNFCKATVGSTCIEMRMDAGQVSKMLEHRSMYKPLHSFHIEALDSPDSSRRAVDPPAPKLKTRGTLKL